MGIPSAKKTDDGTTVSGKRTPTSGLYPVTFGEFCKTRPTKAGQTAPLKDGQWLLPVTYPNGFVDYYHVNHTMNDQGKLRDLDEKKALFFQQGLNTLMDSAGVDDLGGVENSSGYAMWQDATIEAVRAKVYGKTTILPADEYNRRVAAGYVVNDIQAPVQQATQDTRTAAPATRRTTSPVTATPVD